MSYPFPADLRAAIAKKMASGRYASEDDLLRDAVRALAEEEDDWQQIEAALQDYEAGDRGVPLKEAFEQVRRGAEGGQP